MKTFSFNYITTQTQPAVESTECKCRVAVWRWRGFAQPSTRHENTFSVEFFSKVSGNSRIVVCDRPFTSSIQCCTLVANWLNSTIQTKLFYIQMNSFSIKVPFGRKCLETNEIPTRESPFSRSRFGIIVSMFFLHIVTFRTTTKGCFVFPSPSSPLATQTLSYRHSPLQPESGKFISADEC